MKIKLIFLFLFLTNYSFAIDPVEIGRVYQEKIELNLSIIEGLNKNESKEILIKKDIRTKIKKNVEDLKINKKKIEKKEIQKKENNIINKKFARIKDFTGENLNQIDIFFENNSANVLDVQRNNLQTFLSKIQEDISKLKFKVTSYAKSDKGDDIARRISLDRAINIRSILLKEGVAPKNLTVRALGQKKNKKSKVIVEIIKK